MTADDHKDLHSEAGSLRGEHPGRAKNPVIKVDGLAWIDYAKPDLAVAQRFGSDFGFTTSYVDRDWLHLRGSRAQDTPAVIVRRGPAAFVGLAFRAHDHADLQRLARATGREVTPLPESLGGHCVDLVDPSGHAVRVVAGTHPLEALPEPRPLPLNYNAAAIRVNSTQRPPREPARVLRPGHVALQSTKYVETLDWYLEHLGLIVSDFLYHQTQRERGPVMSFIRCDRGDTPADHHTLALALGPANRHLHSAYEVTDLDTLAAGGEYLREQGYQRSWGIGRHVQGSQIFDYWRDPQGFMVEHYTDGDVFDCTLEPGWAPMTSSGLAQWGPPPTRDFLGFGSGRDALAEAATLAKALRADNEFDLDRLRGLMEVARS